MAHLITNLDVSMFQYSHESVNLLITQIYAVFGGLPVNVSMQKNKTKLGEIALWADSSADNYIH